MKTFNVDAGPDNPDIPALEAMRNDNEWVLETRGGETIHITGRLLGYGSSRRQEHTHGVTYESGHRTHNRSARNGQANRCPACRWFEVRILRVTRLTDATPNPYLVHTLGPSVVPGERTFVRADFAVTGFEVIELCTVRQGERGEPYVPAAAARALSQAAGLDRDIQEAYVNRAVA
jgi:hypothetical protein